MDTHSKPIATCFADVTGDNEINVADVLYVIGAWKSSDLDADINSDGVVNVQDLLEVISAWGPC
ncbi:MAG: GC-type dockerin domain-anchored protein [Planctomycetota bacterium]|nr:GC-type dockerin domain-anchored protein [Planctomycetota bacterium]